MNDNKEQKEQPNYYAIIPADVRYDNNLKANEKLLYGEITCLSQSAGKCFASNEYFAKLYGTKKETVSRWVSNLSKRGYVKTQLIYKEGTKQIINRYIQINQGGVDKKVNTPIDKKGIDNNTSINNTSIKRKNKQKDFDLVSLVAEIFEDQNISNVKVNYDAFTEWVEFRKDIKKPLTRISAKKQIKMLIKYTAEQQREMIDASIMNGYQGLFEPKQQKQNNNNNSTDEWTVV